jgi:hypothetical protein
MIPPALLNTIVTVKRRTSTGRDALNNPIYGSPTSGVGWNTAYVNMPVRLAFSSKSVRFAPEGERILPIGIGYYNKNYCLLPEDRVITSDGIEYVITAITVGYGPIGKVIDHYECNLSLP